jgi:hypothetical protein
MLTKSNPGAVGFSPQQAGGRTHYLATEKTIFGFCFVIRFVLEHHPVQGDTLMYLGIY